MAYTARLERAAERHGGSTPLAGTKHGAYRGIGPWQQWEIITGVILGTRSFSVTLNR